MNIIGGARRRITAWALAAVSPFAAVGARVPWERLQNVAQVGKANGEGAGAVGAAGLGLGVGGLALKKGCAAGAGIAGMEAAVSSGARSFGHGLEAMGSTGARSFESVGAAGMESLGSRGGSALEASLAGSAGRDVFGTAGRSGNSLERSLVAEAAGEHANQLAGVAAEPGKKAAGVAGKSGGKSASHSHEVLEELAQQGAEQGVQMIADNIGDDGDDGDDSADTRKIAGRADSASPGSPAVPAAWANLEGLIPGSYNRLSFSRTEVIAAQTFERALRDGIVKGEILVEGKPNRAQHGASCEARSVTPLVANLLVHASTASSLRAAAASTAATDRPVVAAPDKDPARAFVAALADSKVLRRTYHYQLAYHMNEHRDWLTVPVGTECRVSLSVAQLFGRGPE